MQAQRRIAAGVDEESLPFVSAISTTLLNGLLGEKPMLSA